MVDVRTAALIVAFALTGCGKKGPKSATDGAVDLATRAGGDPVQRHPASDACFTTHGGPDWVFSGANDVVDGAGGASMTFASSSSKAIRWRDHSSQSSSRGVWNSSSSLLSSMGVDA